MNDTLCFATDYYYELLNNAYISGALLAICVMTIVIIVVAVGIVSYKLVAKSEKHSADIDRAIALANSN